MHRLSWPLSWAFSVFRGLAAVVDMQLHRSPGRLQSGLRRARVVMASESTVPFGFPFLLQTLRFPSRVPPAPHYPRFKQSALF